MGKKPLMGMASMLLAGVALCGCKGPNHCQHGGCGVPTGGQPGHGNAAWNQQPGGRHGLPTGTMPTGATGAPTGQIGGTMATPGQSGTHVGSPPHISGQPISLPPAGTTPYPGSTSSLQQRPLGNQTGIQGSRPTGGRPIMQLPNQPVQPIQDLRPLTPGAGSSSIQPPPPPEVNDLIPPDPIRGLPTQPEPILIPRERSQSNHPGIVPMPRPDDVPGPPTLDPQPQSQSPPLPLTPERVHGGVQ